MQVGKNPIFMYKQEVRCVQCGVSVSVVAGRLWEEATDSKRSHTDSKCAHSLFILFIFSVFFKDFTLPSV